MGALIFTGGGNSRANTLSPSVVGVPFTAAGFLKPTDFSILGCAFYLGNELASGNDSHRLLINTDGTVRAQSRAPGGTAAVAIPTNSLTLNAWGHVAGVFASNASRRIMLNGDTTDARTNTTSIAVSATLSAMVLGAEKTSTGTTYGTNANCHLANWGMWDVALTDDELVLLSMGVLPCMIRPLRLIHWYYRMGPLAVSSAVPDVMGRSDLVAVNTTTTTAGPVMRGRASTLQEVWRPGPPSSLKRIYFLW